MSEIGPLAPPPLREQRPQALPERRPTPAGSAPPPPPRGDVTPHHLMGARAAANPQAASNLVSLQADTAGGVTGAPVGEPENPLKPGEQTARGIDSGASGLQILGRAARNGAFRRLDNIPGLGVLGPVAGVFGEAASIPKGFADARDSLAQAWESGKREDWIKAGGDTAAVGSAGTSLVKGVLEVPQAIVGRRMDKAAEAAFRASAPGANQAVVDAAVKQAGKEALADSTPKTARRAVTSAATEAAKESSTLARGAGATSRAAAKEILTEGGEAAAKAATKAAGKGLLKAGAKAAGRFVPGLNIGIAALDTAAAAATLADPKAGAGKKVTSVITAAGSIVAATNIPIVSQVGAAVSTVSSFIGSFF